MDLVSPSGNRQAGISYPPTADADAADGRFAAAQKPQMCSVWQVGSVRWSGSGILLVKKARQFSASSVRFLGVLRGSPQLAVHSDTHFTRND